MVAMVDSCGSDVACGKYDAGHDVPVVVYLAAAGEANRVVASRTGDEVTVSDPGAPITVQDELPSRRAARRRLHRAARRSSRSPASPPSSATATTR